MILAPEGSVQCCPKRAHPAPQRVDDNQGGAATGTVENGTVYVVVPTTNDMYD